LTRHLAAEPSKICANCNACAVATKVLGVGCPEERRAIVHAFMSQPEFLGTMPHTRYGHASVIAALEILDGAELDDVRVQLLENWQSLKASRYGRAVLSRLFATTAASELTRTFGCS